MALDQENEQIADPDEVEEEIEQPEQEQEQELQEEPEELTVSIGEEEQPTEEEEERHNAPAWVKELRKERKQLARENRELKAKLAAPPAQPQQVVIGPKPTLAGHDYDEEKFEAELSAWHEKKRKVDEDIAKKQAAETAANADWNKRLDAYKNAPTRKKMEDFDDAEAAALDVLSVTQQAIIVRGIESPDAQAAMIYALGRTPKKAKEIAAIQDPVQFAFAIAKLESQMKVTPRKTAPTPDKAVRGSAPVSGAVDKKLAQLEADADRNGDRSKLIAYKKSLKAK